MSNREGIKVWRYHFPNETEGEGKGQGWGIAILDQSGMFCAFTDWGNYIYKWSAFYKSDMPIDFRSWLLGVGSNYLLSKISEKKEFNIEKTVQWVKQYILSARREKSMDAAAARDEFDLIRAVYNDEDIHLWMRETTFDCPYEWVTKEYPIWAVNFAKYFMPRLKAEIRKELAEEAGVHNYLELCSKLLSQGGETSTEQTGGW